MKEVIKANVKTELRDYISYDEDIKKRHKSELIEAKEEGIEQGIEQGFEQGMSQGIEQGIEKGTEMKMFEIIKNMLLSNMPIEDIKKYTKASYKKINQIKLSIL